MHSDDPCKHRRYKGGREPSSDADHGPVPPPSCSAVGERLARIEDGGVWVSSRVSRWMASLLMSDAKRTV